MYSWALVGYETLFRNDQERCKDIGVSKAQRFSHSYRKEGTQVETTHVSQRVGIEIGQLLRLGKIGNITGFRTSLPYYRTVWDGGLETHANSGLKRTLLRLSLGIDITKPQEPIYL